MNSYQLDGTCKYESFCSFAHGDDELRKKSDNLMLQVPVNTQFMVPQYNVEDPNYFYQFQGGMPQHQIDMGSMYGYGHPGMMPQYMMPPYGSAEFGQIQPLEQFKDQQGANSHLSNLNTINNVIYRPNLRTNIDDSQI